MYIVFAARAVNHFGYYESIIRALADAGHAIEYLCDPQWNNHAPGDRALRRCEAELGNALGTGELIKRTGPARARLFAAREMLSYNSYVNRPEQSRFYEDRWWCYMPMWARRFTKTTAGRWLIGSRAAAIVLRWLERTTPADEAIVESLRKKRPDVVLASPINMRFSEEVEYVKAAKQLGIPTVALVLSWDNLTTKGLFHVHPDRTLAWNRCHADEAKEIHGIKSSTVRVIGSPFFDKWRTAHKLQVDRKDFCKESGVPAESPLLLYLGSSKNIAKDESWLVKKLVEAMRSHSHPMVRKTSLMVRPHPANTDVYGEMAAIGARVWPTANHLPDSEEVVADFYNALRHSVATVGLNTSAMLDAITLDRPSFSILPEEYRNTQTRAVHFQHLMESGALGKCGGIAEFLDELAMVFDGRDERIEARRRFVTEFVWPAGVSAGEAAVEVIEEIAGKKSDFIHKQNKSFSNAA